MISSLKVSHFIVISLLLSFAGYSASAQNVPTQKAPTPQDLKINLDIERYKLENGLTVLLYEDRSAPLVSYNTWFRVGSRDEAPGMTGIAHLFEHMMFKGTKKYGPKEFDRLIQSNGGSLNAFTSHDYTGYYETLPSQKLELAIELESDRMVNLQITEENLKSEREVVKEERRYRVDNSVVGRLFELVYATAYKVHPYRWPVIGWMDDLDKITLEQCRKFYKTFYSPNNAVIVVAGDFKKSDAKALISKYYKNIPAQVLPERNYPQEPKQTSPRDQSVTRDIQSDYFSVAFKAVPSGHPDYYALDVLSMILGDGTSSRLYRRLVYHSQLASAVNVSNSTHKDPGLFQVIVGLKPGVKREEAYKIVFGELWNAREKLYSEKELQAAKSKILNDSVNALKSIHGKAQSIAFNEVVRGSYEAMFEDLEKYNQVTAKQIREVAARYLNPSQRSLVKVMRR